MTKLRNAYTTQVGGVNSVPVTGTKYSPPPPPINAPPTLNVNGVTVPWGNPTPTVQAPPAVVDRRPAIAFGLVLVLLAVGSLVGAVRQVQQRSAPVAAYAPPAALSAPDDAPTSAATVAVPSLAAAPAPVSMVAAYAARPTMTVFCDNVRHEYATAREVGRMLERTPGWQRRCVADYGWCSECQQAWQDAHP